MKSLTIDPESAQQRNGQIFSAGFQEHLFSLLRSECFANFAGCKSR
jgi:hypothetical protein